MSDSLNLKHYVSNNAKRATPPKVSFDKFSCPPAGAPVWNTHPRVYLSAGRSGTAVCPYCGTRLKQPE
jgi:uncharacterized Zn-finger protein